MFTKLNSRGFSHHLLAPVLVIAVVVVIGGVIMNRISNAATYTDCSKIKIVKYRPTKPYSRGTCIKKMQDRLKTLGYLTVTKTDQYYTPKMNTAVIAFQKKNNLAQNGLNAATLAKLFSSSAIAASPTTTTGTIKKVAPGVKWDWIISGTPSSKHLDAYTSSPKLIDIDLENTSSSTISSFKNKGIIVICYYSAGSYENWRADASKFPKAVIGKSNGWAGENWLDIRSSAVLDVMKARMDSAVSKGCDGVEPDNVDGYSNSTGFPLTASNQITFNKNLSIEAHKRGLLIALKNDVEQVSQLAGSFDFAINEQCNEYDECGVYSAFTSAGKAVLNAEYGKLNCAATNAANIDSVLFALDLDGSKYTPCR